MADPLNITDDVARHARLDPSQPSVVSRGRRFSRGELERLMAQAAVWLRRQGIGAGDMVAICGLGPVRDVVLSLALSYLGVLQHGIVPAQLSGATVEMLRRLGCRAVFSGSEVGELPGIPRLGFRLDMLQGIDPGEAAGLRCGDGDAPLYVATTSGTTGEPKVMLITHRQFHSRMTHAGVMAFDGSDRLLSLLDLGVLVQRSLVVRGLMSGTAVHFGRFASAREIVACCNAERITILFALPFMLSRWLRAIGAEEDARMRHVRRLMLAGSTVTVPDFEAAVARFTPNVFVAYGSNEVATVCCADLEMRRRHPLAVGRAIPGAAWEILDEDGRTLPAGVPGRIRVRTMGMVEGYHQQEALTRHHFRDGWFHPGDLLSATEDGMLLFHGRADDMMIFDGVNIYPAEIESTLRSHPGIVDAAAFPLHSAVHQDVPVAAVVTEHPLDEAEMIAWCRQRLGVRRPQRIVRVEALPTNALGKVVKKQLAEQIASELKRRG
jgi:acyl-coenzyme A synthetase/AMP-(fatty) acid ligase